jgi:O-6-methylguanine DNA methyltransferase
MTTYYHSPVGTWEATWRNSLLVRLELLSAEVEKTVEASATSRATTTQSLHYSTRALSSSAQSSPAHSAPQHLGASRLLETQLAQFFAGLRPVFSVPYSFAGTQFQEAVWRELEKIPLGETTTYGELARLIGKPKAVRAVGTAVGKNPIALLIGCHRVLGSNSLGGYAYGLGCKKILLALEGYVE